VSQAWVQRPAGRRQQLPAAGQVETVVGVAAVGGTAAGPDQVRFAQQAQVVGDQALLFAEQCSELVHLPIAAGERAE
jgi:hypothetical protein